jgi:hypothetical protein
MARRHIAARSAARVVRKGVATEERDPATAIAARALPGGMKGKRWGRGLGQRRCSPRLTQLYTSWGQEVA